MQSFKNDYCFAYLDDQGIADQFTHKLAGFYLHDIRHLSVYHWDFGDDFLCIAQNATLNRLWQHYSITGHHHEQGRIQRQVMWNASGFDDHLSLYNPQDKPLAVQLTLHHQADFMDIFALRSKNIFLKAADIQSSDMAYGARLQDGSHVKTCLSPSILPSKNNRWEITLEPKQSLELVIQVKFENDQNILYPVPLNLNQWQGFFAASRPSCRYEAKIYDASVDDLYYLLLSTKFGFYPAAGTPLFVTPFGRDALITADFLVDKAPFLAKSVLGFAANIQGCKHDSYYEEEPGKIFHEVRNGTLAKLGKIPFVQYYGTADATPLWLKLLGRYMEVSKDLTFLQQHQSHVISAFDWIIHKINKNGYIQFMPEGRGLANQNWKDSPGANCHKDGHQAKAPIANIDVQAYTYAALEASEKLFHLLGEKSLAAKAATHRQSLFDRIQTDFWLKDEGFYAMGLDADLKPLAVCSSNMGHVLWCRAAPEDKAAMVIERLMQNDMWSGWGLRTLSNQEKAYNPLGYHVGTIWPHDTAIFALGASYYGRYQPKALVKNVLMDMAFCAVNLRLPEVAGGFDRSYSLKPIPYVNSCIPQAWAAAALIGLF